MGEQDPQRRGGTGLERQFSVNDRSGASVAFDRDAGDVCDRSDTNAVSGASTTR